MRSQPLKRYALQIPNLTKTLDTTIACTVCHGKGIVYIKGIDDPIWKSKLERCPECGGSREMKSRTTEEQENLRASKG